MEEDQYIEGLDDDDEGDNHEDNQHMQNKPNSSKAQASWASVLQFLKYKQREIDVKETEWMIEKHQLQQKISMLEAQNKAYENSNND